MIYIPEITIKFTKIKEHNKIFFILHKESNEKNSRKNVIETF